MPQKLQTDFVANLRGVGITSRQRDRFPLYLEETATGCLVFTGAKWHSGHGQYRIGNSHNCVAGRAHCVAWVLSGRELPDGMELMHNCPGGDNPACCNVDHLWLGDKFDHARDKSIKGQTRKSQIGLPPGVRIGHGYDETTYEAYISRDGKPQWLGAFKSIEEASLVAEHARDKRAEEWRLSSPVLAEMHNGI